jgi:large subunit ribosomal protein L10
LNTQGEDSKTVKEVIDLAISKELKEVLVDQYKNVISENSAVILTSNSGLSVKEMEGLRKNIREVGGEFLVVKNTLVKRAFDETDTPMPEGGLEGTTAIGATTEDVIGLAKAIVDLSREVDTFKIKGAIIDGDVVETAQIRMLADLPPLPVLQSQLLSVLQAPAAKVAGVLNGSVRQVVTVIKAYAEKEPVAA